MKVSTILVATLSFLSMLLASEATTSPNNADGHVRKRFDHGSRGGSVSFDSEQEKFRIDWTVTIPFVSIPLGHRTGEHGEVPSVFRVNAKTLGIVALLSTLFGAIAPLFSKTHPRRNYRSGENAQWLRTKDAINEMVFGNNYVAPCTQRVVCSIVSVAVHAVHPTSTDKIIDGLSSHEWFKDVTNGTIVQHAVNTARKGDRDCARVYNDCPITLKLLKTMMNEFSVM